MDGQFLEFSVAVFLTEYNSASLKSDRHLIRIYFKSYKIKLGKVSQYVRRPTTALPTE